MFKLPRWKAEWFKEGQALDLIAPDWDIELQMAKVPIGAFAAMTMGCTWEVGIDSKDSPIHLTPQKRRIILEALHNRLRVIENNRNGGGFPSCYYNKSTDYCLLKDATQWVHDRGWELPAPMLTFIDQGQTEKTMLPEEFPRSHPKWRLAYEFESEGMNAIYDLIEKYFIDAKGNPIYDPDKWPVKKIIESDWLITGSRTLREVDLTITSRKRKGRAKK